MRALLCIASIALLTLAGCKQPPPPPSAAELAEAARLANAPPPVAANVPALRGAVSIVGTTTLPPTLDLRLRLLDMSDPSIAPPVVAERIEPAPKTLPYSYALPYEPSKIGADRTYVIEASLLAGGAMLYGTPAPTAVLSNGAGNQADLVLARGGFSAAESAPADLLKVAFEALEGSIGGMERLTGERINDDVTIGWDGFAAAGDVRFARENVDYGDAGSASLRYGYKDGKPWVIAREQKGVTSLLGWGDDGAVVLNRHGDGGQLDEAAIDDLRSQAERLYGIVKARVPAG